MRCALSECAECEGSPVASATYLSIALKAGLDLPTVVPGTSTTSRSGQLRTLWPWIALHPFTSDALVFSWLVPDVPFRHEQFPDPFGLFACLARLRLPCLVQAIALGYTRPRPTYRVAPKCAKPTAQIPVRPCSPPLNPSLVVYRLPTTTANGRTSAQIPSSLPLRQSRSVPRD